MPSPRPEDGDDPTRTKPPIPPAAAPLAEGSELFSGNYVIEAVLGRGGMGEVYRARHIHEEDRYAIKVILPDIAKDDTVIQLFRREAQALKQVNHDAIVRYRDFLRTEDGRYCLVMEFVGGESLGHVLQRRRFEPDEVFVLLRRLGQGLAAVHDLGIVHRDISPENILLPDVDIGHAKLIDFGIAKTPDPSAYTLIGGDFAGKMSFASPEQADPDRFSRIVDRRSDIYSLGLVLAAAALGFGKRLDMGGSLANIVRARQSVPDLSALPPSLRPLIAHMLQPRPQDRPASMREVLDGVPAGGPQRQSVSQGKRTSKRLRNGAIWLGGLTLAVAAVALATPFVARLAFAPPVKEVRNDFAAITSAYQCADLAYTVNTNRTANVSGYVQSDSDLATLHNRIGAVSGVSGLAFDVHRRAWPYCEASALLKPYLGDGGNAATVTLATVHPSAGDPLILDVRSPGFDSYVYIDYFRADGAVLHLFPNPMDWFNLRPVHNRFVLGRAPMRDCWAFSGIAGEQMMTMVAARQPLFKAALPSEENAKSYLPVLTAALKRGAVGDVSAAVLFYDLRPGTSSPTSAGCAVSR